MPDHSLDRPEVTRRVVLRGVAVGGVAMPLLVACGEDPETAGDTPVAGDGNTGNGGGGGAGSALASTSDVPVGGGQILSDEKIVVTQPAKDEFKAFSAVCTHQGCVVGSISDGVIQCPCHGSEYSIEDGSVLGGPAPKALPRVAIKVSGGEITRA